MNPKSFIFGISGFAAAILSFVLLQLNWFSVYAHNNFLEAITIITAIISIALCITALVLRKKNLMEKTDRKGVIFASIGLFIILFEVIFEIVMISLAVSMLIACVNHSDDILDEIVKFLRSIPG